MLFRYIIDVETDTAEHADVVIAERIGYDEDLSEYGIEDYWLTYVAGPIELNTKESKKFMTGRV